LARKILLADDSVTAQNMGRKILADAGYEVITVNNGSAALKKIAETKPDLIVLDVYMPGYSGLEVCQRLKDVGETARTPVLLTVGKLEPFKPEEAKRVRADGFIVKPFEASELLSALSKLEDKVVPRAESSKPGRFARATAAIEEGRYDKSMSVDNEDSGWKNRISFPPKKKEKPPEQEVDTAEIYNPVNKDLRTLIEHKVSEPASDPAHELHEEQYVNVGALAPEGLPKDVTPEEIAALAAAAAQIQGKVAQDKSSTAETPVTAAPIEVVKSETVEAAIPANVEPAKVDAPAPAPAPTTEVAANAASATVPAPEVPEKAEEKKPEHKSGPAEVMAAIAGLETEWVSVPYAGSGDGSPLPRSEHQEDEPVTMAVAAGAGSSAVASRWTAVAVALAPEEAAISLEQEMHKAYAAFAAAEGGHAEAASPTAEKTSAVAEAVAEPTPVAEAPMAETSVMEVPAAVLPTVPPEAAEPPVVVSDTRTKEIPAAVKELEVVASRYEEESSAASTELAPDGSFKAEKAEALESAAPVSEPESKLEEKSEVEEKPQERNGSKLEDKVEALAQEPTEAPAQEEPPVVEAVAPQIAPQEPEKKDEPPSVIETPEVVAKVEVPEEKPSSEDVSTEPVPNSSASTTGGIDEMAKRESETAQAWATWRKIRETGTPKPAQPAEASLNEPEESIPQDKAAMAVAVGAESNPEEATNSLDSDPEIASIVDSVLADMRPKIVEEIARKLGKKK
jgi:CheY-like chemotaxis protein